MVMITDWLGTGRFTLSGTADSGTRFLTTINDDTRWIRTSQSNRLVLPSDGPWLIWLSGELTHESSTVIPPGNEFGIAVYDDDDDALLQTHRFVRQGDNSVIVAFNGIYLVRSSTLSFRVDARTAGGGNTVGGNMTLRGGFRGIIHRAP